MSQFQIALKKLRTLSRLTQRDVATQLGVSQWVISRVETGRTNITPERFDAYLIAVVALNAQRKGHEAA